VSVAPELWLDRYRSGESAAVWGEMRDLGGGIRSGPAGGYARAVAAETMAIAAKNIDALVARLQALGYRFAHAAPVRRPPSAQTATQLDAFEARHGPMPLSLRAFYEVAGTVDLTQSATQLIQWWPQDRRAEASELEIAGEYDPLVVEPLDYPKSWPGLADRAWFFACDEFHKANYSGGANYHVVLPDDGADFRIYGMTDDSEFFVDYLRAAFKGGGFRGKSESDESEPGK
jgi:hypothetical protein